MSSALKRQAHSNARGHRYRYLGTLGILAKFCLYGPAIGAQVDPATQVAVIPANPAAVIPARLTGVTTDTGAFAYGHQDFSRYPNPLACVAAIGWTSAVARANIQAVSILDTLQDLAADTIGLERVRAVARACGNRFTLANTPDRYLPALLQVAQSTQNDTLAVAVFMRIIQTVGHPARVRQAFSTLNLLMGGRELSGQFVFTPVPGQGGSTKLQELYTLDRPLMQALIHLIDQEGSMSDRVLLQEELREYWKVRHDMAAALRQSNQVLAAARQLPPHTLVNVNYPYSTAQPVWKVYHDLLRYAFYHWPDSLPAITQRAQRDLGVWQSYVVVLNTVQRGPIIDFPTLSPEATIDTLWPGHARWKESGRTVIPPLHADFWFGVAPHTVLTTAPSVQGHVTFIMDGTVAAHGRIGARQASMVRHMLAQYGTQGLAVIAMVGTEGWIDYGSALPGPELLAPAAEAEQIRSYYQEYEHLPVMVGVQVHHYRKLPLPDGRLAQADTLHLAPPNCDFDDGASYPGVGCAQLVDRDGTVLWHGNMLSDDLSSDLDDGVLFGIKSEFSDVLNKAFTETSSTGPTRAASAQGVAAQGASAASLPSAGHP